MSPAKIKWYVVIFRTKNGPWHVKHARTGTLYRFRSLEEAETYATGKATYPTIMSMAEWKAIPESELYNYVSELYNYVSELYNYVSELYNYVS